ncbi:hypothetical protein Bca52824_033109 [Brassica carinata]|uniref:Uncharacterized protein n=1 Tax=Brassica carinata TaxID=52824 RepID=A0A8X7SE50_BRACI|nr:hypothetical protein Bca52824_033109 [Brassica carinata]
MESRRSCQGKEIAEETAEVEDVKEGLPERLLRWTEKFAVMEARVEEMGKEVARLTGVCEKQERELNKWKKMLKGRSATKRRRSLRKKAKRDNDQGVQLQLIIRMLAVTGFRMVQCKVTVMMLHARQERVDGLLQWVDKGTSVAGESGDVDGVRGNVYPLSYVKQDSSVDGGGGENQRTVDGLDGMEQEKLNVLVENVMKDSGGCLDLKGDEETLGGHGCGSKADAAKDEMGEQQAESLSVADGGAGVEETPQEERGEIVTVSVANSTAGDDVKKVVEKEGDEGRNGNVAECAIGSKGAELGFLRFTQLF